jgi:amidase
MYVPLGLLRGLTADDVATSLTPIAYRHFEAAQSYSTLDLLQAIAGNNTVTRAFAGFFEIYDLLLCPSCAVRTPSANGPYSLLRDEALDTWLGRFADAGRYTIPGNEAGVPGISVPAGTDSGGVPIGVMLYAGQGREDTLLAIAAILEAERPAWFSRIPPVSVVYSRIAGT